MKKNVKRMTGLFLTAMMVMSLAPVPGLAEEITLTTIVPRQKPVTVAYHPGTANYAEPAIPLDELVFYEPTGGGGQMQPMRIKVKTGDVVRILMTGSMRGLVYGSLVLVSNNGANIAGGIGSSNLLTGLSGSVWIPTCKDGTTYYEYLKHSFSSEDTPRGDKGVKYGQGKGETFMEWRPFAIQRVDRATADGVFEYKLNLSGKPFHTSSGGPGAWVSFAYGRVAVLEVIDYEPTPPLP
jgi:hypothetical protein